MSAVELAMEHVKGLSEPQARMLLAWLDGLKAEAPQDQALASARAARGFARRYRPTARTTADWMKELREGEP